MTWFGKILVLFNLVLSVSLMIIALVLFTTRTDWSNNQAKDGNPEGVLRARIAQVNALWNLIPDAENSWRKSRDTLSILEEGTKPDFQDGWLANREWYAVELQFLRTGADVGKPAREVERDKDTNQIILDAANHDRPKMIPAKDRSGTELRSLAAYDKEETGFFAALQQEQDRLEKAIKEDTKLTEMFLDDYPMKGGKGLHTRLKEERVRFEEVKSELELVQRPLINAYVDADLLLKRKRQMENRLEELQKARAAQLTGLGQK